MSVANMVKGLGLVLITTLLVAGCGGSSGTASPPVAAESSSLSRNLAPVVPQSTESAVAASVNLLGRNLLGQELKNIVVAPFSASLSLARLRAGAAGQPGLTSAPPCFFQVWAQKLTPSTTRSISLSVPVLRQLLSMD